MNCRACLALMTICVLIAACQSYKWYQLEVRDAKTIAPVQIDVEVSYLGEKDNGFLIPSKQTYESSTNESGVANIRVARNSIWVLRLRLAQSEQQFLLFKANLEPDSFQMERHYGWVLTHLGMWTHESGTYEVRVTPPAPVD